MTMMNHHLNSYYTDYLDTKIDYFNRTVTTTKPPQIHKEPDSLTSRSAIPIIDLALTGTDQCPHPTVVKNAAAKLLKAFSEKGLAYLVNHGISDYEIGRARNSFNEFCKLPKESRAKYESSSPTEHGYLKPETEDYTIGDTESRHEYIISGKNTPFPNEDLPEFRPRVNEIARDMRQISITLLTALNVALERPTDFFTKKHAKMLNKGNKSSFRMRFYPPTAVIEPGTLRYEPTTDSGTFTLLHRYVENGMEMKMPKSDRWELIGCLPGAILVYVGDALSKWTDHQMPALQYRITEPSHRSSGRYTLTYSVEPDEGVVIDPMNTKIVIPSPEPPVICRLQKKKRGVLSAYHNLQRRFRETYAS